MPSNLDRYRDELDALLKKGTLIQYDLLLASSPPTSEAQRDMQKLASGAFDREYQGWYSASMSVVRQLLPQRSTDFEEAYRADPRRKAFDYASYRLSDRVVYMVGLDGLGQERFSSAQAAYTRFTIQLDILKAAQARLDSAVHDIEQLLQADLHDSELGAAAELAKKKFLRPSGVVAGVVLEAHLKRVASSHNVRITKRDPTLSDLNEALKKAEVYDLTTWRFIGHLTDLRNLCGHDKDREPTREDVDALIAGVSRTIKTVS